MIVIVLPIKNLTISSKNVKASWLIYQTFNWNKNINWNSVTLPDLVYKILNYIKFSFELLIFGRAVVKVLIVFANYSSNTFY